MAGFLGFSVRKVGGIWHWRVGRVVGSVSVKRQKTVWEQIAENRRAFDRDMKRLQKIADAPLHVQRKINARVIARRVATGRVSSFIAGLLFTGIAF